MALLVGMLSCNHRKHETMLLELPASASGIDFVNEVSENDSLNIMTYEYLYNGGGVAIGDINQDGLQDIFLIGNMVPNKLFLNKGELKFEDITGKAGVAGRNKWKTGVSMVDINSDGLLDLYVCYSGPGTDLERKNELYINTGSKNGIPVFSEKAAEYGLDAPGSFSTQCAFFDMDRDGDLDAFLVNHADMFYNVFFNSKKLRTLRHPKFGNRLYRNDKGKFIDISEEAGIFGGGANFGLGVATGDINADGWPDIYVTNDYNEQDYLYLNNGDGSFREVTKESFGHISQFSMGCGMEDLNNDNLLDLITLDMLPEDNYRQKLLKGPDGYDYYTLLVDSGFHHQNMRNMLQLNQGNDPHGFPRFSEIGQLTGISTTDWSWSPLLVDFDNNGWKDIFITNGYLRDFTNMDFLKYTYAEADAKARREGIKLKTWELVKQLKSTRIHNYLYSNKGNLSFEDKSTEWGVEMPTISNGAAFGDLDNDGDMDLIVNNINQQAGVYKNNADQKSKHHFIKLRFKGTAGNSFGIGTKAKLTIGSSTQYRELYPVQGYLSSMEPVLHFGIGNDSVIDKIEIQWPDNKLTLLNKVKADTTLLIDYTNTRLQDPIHREDAAALFVDITKEAGLNFVHKENVQLVDFKKQVLLPYQVSRPGPFLAKADINGDGLEDIFVGGNDLQPGQLFLQRTNFKFTLSESQPWVSDGFSRYGAMVFIDVDTDGDADLLVSGMGKGAAENAPHYQTILYVNDGKGRYEKSTNSLPVLASMSTSIAVADYDKDGDPDFFFAGSTVPGKYPLVPVSYLVRNETKGNKIAFVYASEQPEKLLRNPGMITSAVWGDLNKDSWPDLVLAGEFMPVMAFENNKGSLQDVTKKRGLAETAGWWSAIAAVDLDRDGDLDLVAGNKGYNFQFKTTVEHPLSLVYDDFDKNGSIDPLLFYYNQGISVPVASLDEITDQLPSLKKKFLRYETYAKAQQKDLLSSEQMSAAHKLEVKELRSVLFENTGNGFRLKNLPVEVQFSPVNGIVCRDFNSDGIPDLLVGGNYYPWRVQWGKMDAGFGWLLLGKGELDFAPVYPSHSGLWLDGDVRSIQEIHGENNRAVFVVAKNNDSVQLVVQGSRAAIGGRN
ncbi:MAG: hypothetical protein A1D16_20140 [Flavihumibacter sp. CACIAM 22H1]|nr:MAG: hypothetical protein A1D16_20140 [Flavihumibacter sp. CACIAM 22H1]